MYSSKKGVFFYPFFILWTLFLFFVFFIAVINPIDRSEFNKEGSLLFDLSTLPQSFDVESLFLQREIEKEIVLRKALAPSQILSSGKKLTECKISIEGKNSFLLYDERVEEKENVFCFRKSLEDQELPIEKLLWERLTLGLEEKFSSFFLDSYLYTLPSQNNQKRLDLEIDEEEKTIQYTFGRSLNLEEKAFDQNAIVHYDENYFSGSKKFSSYLNLFTFLETQLPLVSSHLTQTPSCSVQTSLCLETFFSDAMSSQLREDFELSFETKELKDDEEHLSFLLEVKEKETGEVFSFIVIFKNTLSLGEVEFELSQYSAARKAIKLSIVKPELFADAIQQYLVVYAPIDFLDSNNAQSFKDELLKRQDFSTFDIRDSSFSGDVTVAVSSKEGVVPVTYLITSADKNFEERDGKVVKNILIYEKYDYTKDSFVLLDSNKKYFFYVFALDERFAYYMSEEQKTKSFLLNELYSPLPLSHEFSSAVLSSVSLEVQPSGIKHGVKVDIENYIHENYDHYDVYITRNRANAPLNRFCQGSSYECYYFNGASRLGKSSSLSFILTDEANSLSLSPSLFSPSFTEAFNSGGSFELVVVPVTSQREGVLNDYQLEYEFTQLDNEVLVTNLDGEPQRLRKLPFSISPLVQEDVLSS